MLWDVQLCDDLGYDNTQCCGRQRSIRTSPALFVMILVMMTHNAVGDSGPIRTSPALFVMIVVMMTHNAVGHSAL